MARGPYETRRTGDQVLIDSNTKDIADLETRVSRIERLMWWVLGGASGVGFVVGALAKQAAKIILP